MIRKKALNPLISDELISLITTTDKDANNAIALTLASLKPAFAALTTNKEAEAITALEHMQAEKLYDLLVIDKDPTTFPSLKPPTILDNSYTKSKEEYDVAKIDLDKITIELNSATEELNAAQITLKSLQSGLAAATAAFLAS